MLILSVTKDKNIDISAHKILVRKSKGERPLGRPRHRLEDNIKMYVKGNV
jgi:hypothetical protein